MMRFLPDRGTKPCLASMHKRGESLARRNMYQGRVACPGAIDAGGHETCRRHACRAACQPARPGFPCSCCGSCRQRAACASSAASGFLHQPHSLPLRCLCQVCQLLPRLPTPHFCTISCCRVSSPAPLRCLCQVCQLLSKFATHIMHHQRRCVPSPVPYISTQMPLLGVSGFPKFANAKAKFGSISCCQVHKAHPLPQRFLC